ncbi:hypothetical protein [Candidatus Magnetominusculus xianensis]|nr:hypothetical protein [Candidatus Magnetominusculus xianensis]MBF0403645.1 hypothetical protein [Nitrospirota bacterium]
MSMGGCLVQSQYGIVSDDRSNLSYNKNLYGQWTNETNLYNIFYNPNTKTSYYWVVEADEKIGLAAKSDIVEFNLVKIAGSLYVDMQLTEYKGKKTHNILKIEFIDPNTLYVYLFNLDKDYLQRHSDEITFANSKGAADSEDFLITSGTKQLQQFIKKHDHLFDGNPLVFRKVKGTNNDTVKGLLKSYFGIKNN